MKKNILLSIGIVLSIFISSCSSKLSREEAEKQIKLSMNYPQSLTDNIIKIVAEQGQLQGNNGQLDTKYFYYFPDFNIGHYPFYKQLINDGYLTLSSKVVTIDPNDYYFHHDDKIWTCQSTEKAKEFILSEDSKGYTIKTGTRDFGEITGIVERKENSTCEVSFTEHTKATPIGMTLNRPPEVSDSRTIVFTKYDDGWRIGH